MDVTCSRKISNSRLMVNLSPGQISSIEVVKMNVRVNRSHVVRKNVGEAPPGACAAEIYPRFVLE